MYRLCVLTPVLLMAGCLARVERAVIPVREPEQALAKSAAVLKREGFVVRTVDLRRGLVRTTWRFTERRDGEGFLYYRYLVEQKEDAEEIAFRIEVIRCQFAPAEGDEWGKSGCDRMPPRVPMWAESDYQRIADILRGVHRPRD